jgi:hypothetical protein
MNRKGEHTMANPCQFLQDQVDKLEQQIQELEDLVNDPDLPPKSRAAIRAEILKLNRKLQRLRSQLDACEQDPTPYLLQMAGIEVTQAIQDMQHSVALVAGKATAVRIYLSYYALPDIFVRGELLARSDSGEFVTVFSANQALLSSANADNLRAMRQDASLSLNFILPSELTAAGGWNFSLSSLVNAVSGASLTVLGLTSIKVRFVNAAPLRVRVFGVRYSMGNPPVQFTPSDQDFNLLFSWLRRAYPVAQVIGSRALIDISPSAPSPFGSGDVNAQLAAIRALDVSGGVDRRTHYYGLVSDGGFFMRGSAAGIPATPDPSTVASGPTGPANWGWDNDGSYGDWYGGHELGHTFGRLHPGFCGESHDDPNYPFANGQLADNDDSFIGFDIGDSTLGLPPAALPGNIWHDVMTYCDHQWLSSYTYKGIHTRLSAEDALPAGPTAPGSGSSGGPPDRRFPQGMPPGTPGSTPENLISVVARVNLSRNEGQIRHVQPVAEGRVEAGVFESPVVLRLKTATEEILNEYRVAVKLDSDRDERGEETGLVDVIVFASPEARQIELVIGERTADTFRAGAPPQPIQNVLKSEGPAFMGLSWEGGAVAGEGMSYAVQASTDEAHTWFTVAVGLKTPQFAFDPKQFPGARKIHIRILATNGFTQTVAPSEVFEVAS